MTVAATRLFAALVAGMTAVVAAPAAAQAPAKGFADLAERLGPAVVDIRTSQNVAGGLPQFPPGSPLERFNDYLGGAPRTENSLGSGFVIDADGVIITNDHVVADADEIEIVFVDGLVLKAVLVGSDEATDLAVLRVDTDIELPHVSFGDSESARVGDWVVAIGNPFGLGNTLTVGVVSARNRDIRVGDYDSFIQTDAAINRGNSGGPLFNLEGEVIGVNSAILSPSGGSVGIGFSIPSNLARSVVDQLLEFGETRRGWIGVGIQNVNAGIAESFGLRRPRGALVSRVDSGSPAEEAGLQPGDLILTFGDRPVEDDRALSRFVAEAEIGSVVDVEFLRQRERMETALTIGQLEQTPRAAVVEEASAAAPAASSVLGLTLGPINPDTRREFNLPADATGVVVLDVDAGSDAAGKVNRGDVIEEIAWEKVASPAEATEVAEAAADEGKAVLLLINRDGQLVFQSVRPSVGR